MLSEIKDVVDLVVKINFKRLMTIFNIVFICPVGISCKVQETVSLQGAAKTQCGLIVNKIPPSAREGTVHVCDLNTCWRVLKG